MQAERVGRGNQYRQTGCVNGIDFFFPPVLARAVLVAPLHAEEAPILVDAVVVKVEIPIRHKAVCEEHVGRFVSGEITRLHRALGAEAHKPGSGEGKDGEGECTHRQWNCVAV